MERNNLKKSWSLLPDKMQIAIIKKDIKSIAVNKKVIITLIVMPLAMTIIIPSSFLLPVLLSPEGSQDLSQLLELINLTETVNLQYALINLVLNYILPLFFILIPIMTSSVMSTSSFVGEKEKNTLETLLYCPLPLNDIFNAKILASLILGMAVSFFSFIIMLAVNGTIIYLLTEIIIIPNVNWLIVMFLVSPAASLISISLIVRSSAKAQTSEESSITSLFLVLPVILLAVAQFSGIMMMSAEIFLLLGAVMAVIAFLMYRNLFGKFKYETLLR